MKLILKSKTIFPVAVWSKLASKRFVYNTAYLKYKNYE